jgi:hypothetical protein
MTEDYITEWLKTYLPEKDNAWREGFATELEALISKAQEEERLICKQIYVDGVDWAEWAVSDKEAGENFDEEYNSLKGEEGK